MDREKRERDWDIWFWAKPGRTSNIYIYIYIKRSSINREGIEHLSRTKSRKINRYRGGIDGKMILIDRGGIKHLSSKKKKLQRTGSMDRAIYWEVLRTNPKVSIEEACIEELSSSYWGGIKLLLRGLKGSFRGTEAAQDECNQDRHQNKQSKSMFSIKTHPQL